MTPATIALIRYTLAVAATQARVARDLAREQLGADSRVTESLAAELIAIERAIEDFDALTAQQEAA